MSDSGARVATRERAGARPGVSVPAAGCLSNGRYTMLLTAAGTGLSSCDEVALNAWSRDPIEDRGGLNVYVRDAETRVVWSLGARPVLRPAERYAARWRPGRFEIERLDVGLETRLEACVAPAAPFEIRRITIANHSDRERRIEITTCLEVALLPAAAHATHPEFSKLFVQTECPADHLMVLARRRPRGRDERHPWLAHAVLEAGPLEIETDRARFVGRGGSWSAPYALRGSEPLSGTTGNVLDPVLSLRRTIVIAPGERERLTFLIGVGADRHETIEAVEAWSETAIDHAFEQAAANERRVLDRLGIAETLAADLHAVGGALMYGVPALGPSSGRSVTQGEAGVAMADHGLVAGTPFVLIEAEGDARALGGYLGASAYWQGLGVPCQVLVVARDPAALESALARLGDAAPRVVARASLAGGAFERLMAAASLVIAPARESVAIVAPTASAPHVTTGGWGGAVAPAGAREVGAAAPRAANDVQAPATRFDEPLVHFNGTGGFTREGDAYVIRLAHRDGEGLVLPPRPWVNVIANETFGCLVSETGAICTWSGNSRLRRLTPWSNDPLLDPHGEAFHLRDESTGAWWSPLPGPSPAAADYELRHGFGWSACRHESHGVVQETNIFVARGERARIVRVRVRDVSGAARRLSLFAYHRLVLGVLPEESAASIVTEIAPAEGALLARNPDGAPFAERVAFAAAAAPPDAALQFTCDREAYLGRHGGPERPAAMALPALDGRAGARLDPCFAIQVTFDLAAGETKECAFLLGDADDRAAAMETIERLRGPGAIAAALERARGFWNDLLAGVRVRTPVPAIDLMVNGWLAYQTLSCRMWGRTAFYQSGGAFGFRDQLQDAAALVWLAPERTREQILLHAAHQFAEGDVLHWWHPPSGHGIRTRFADDLLWLPFVASSYMTATGDRAILDERAPFLTARALVVGEDEAYVKPEANGGVASLYEHCCRAIDRSLATGAHGLPLFGSGDWNDGMNRVGREGRGESVWMAFFLATVLHEFLPICRGRGDAARAERYAAHHERLAAAIETKAWDGAWYVRGFYDDGTPLGSHASDECRIDALVQSWSVLSGLAEPRRARAAMDAVERHLVAERDGIIRLLAPPFENTSKDPGYIRGYVAGVRENGGQYTHAALWVVRALATLGRRDRAARLLEMLSPVTRAATPASVATYRIEPYVIAADVYGAAPHVGRGGWTWYTGSAGWMLRVALESVLGLELVEGASLTVRPCIPDDWPGFEVSLRVGDSRYDVQVLNPNGHAAAVVEARLDGANVPVEDGAARVPLVRDGRDHVVHVVLG